MRNRYEIYYTVYMIYDDKTKHYRKKFDSYKDAVNFGKSKQLEDGTFTVQYHMKEIKIGKWIKHNCAEEVGDILIPNYECSLCHTWERKTSNYCPDCGHPMI